MEENKLTNSEIAKVMAMYVPCDTVQGGNNFNRRLVAVGGFEDGEFLYGKLKNKASVSAQFVQNFQLLLTPLSDIKDEHAIEVAGFVFSETVSLNEKIRIGKNFIDYMYLGKALGPYDAQDINEFMSEQHIEIFQQLFLWGYAVPIYFGINHWANNKTAIELEIAVNKTLNK